MPGALEASALNCNGQGLHKSSSTALIWTVRTSWKKQLCTIFRFLSGDRNDLFSFSRCRHKNELTFFQLTTLFARKLAMSGFIFLFPPKSEVKFSEKTLAAKVFEVPKQISSQQYFTSMSFWEFRNEAVPVGKTPGRRKSWWWSHFLCPLPRVVKQMTRNNGSRVWIQPGAGLFSLFLPLVLFTYSSPWQRDNKTDFLCK